MAITKETLNRVAELAHVNFKEGSEEKLMQELENIIEWVGQLNEVDIQNTEPLYSVSLTQEARRPDIAIDENLQTELMQNAPDSVHGFYAVPKMVE